MNPDAGMHIHGHGRGHHGMQVRSGSVEVDAGSVGGDSTGYEYNRKKFMLNRNRSGNISDTGNMNDELEDMVEVEEITSTGLSDSIYFENEWYDESDPNAPRSAKNSGRSKSGLHVDGNDKMSLIELKSVTTCTTAATQQIQRKRDGRS